jgi:hypothetical protein
MLDAGYSIGKEKTIKRLFQNWSIGLEVESKNKFTATSGELPATSNKQPAASGEFPATSNKQPATSSQYPAKKAPDFSDAFSLLTFL